MYGWLINSYGSFIIKEEDAVGYNVYFAIEGDTEYVPCVVVYDCGLKF